MKEMTPRERVYAAVNFEEPDRVPIGFAGMSCAGMLECPPDGCVCSELYRYLGLEDAEPPAVGPVFNMVLNTDERAIVRLHGDMRVVYPEPPAWTTEPDGTMTWPWWMGMRGKKVGFYDNPFEWPMKHMTTEKDIDEYPWPDTSVNIATESVVERMRYLHEETDYFVVGDTFYGLFPFNGYGYLSGMEKWLSDLKVRPKFYHKLAEKMLEYTLAFDAQFYKAVGQYVDAAVFYDDLGSQEGLLMSPKDYKEFYSPYSAEIIKNIRKYIRPEAKILRHSCGSVYEAIPDLIEIGVDILNPLQPLAWHMEPWRLKKEFGGKIAFMGGFDIQKLVPLGTIEEIREGAKKLIATYAPGGGYIFAPSHNIEPDTPPENIVAMFDAAYEYGKYPTPALTGERYVDYISGLDLKGRELGPPEAMLY